MVSEMGNGPLSAPSHPSSLGQLHCSWMQTSDKLQERAGPFPSWQGLCWCCMRELVSSSCAQQVGKSLGFSLQNCNYLHPHMQLDEKKPHSYLATKSVLQALGY